MSSRRALLVVREGNFSSIFWQGSGELWRRRGGSKWGQRWGWWGREGRKGERKSDGDENDGDDKVLESTSGSLRYDRPFILPKKWTVNDFLPTMSNKVFNTLRDRYQILDNIPIYLPGKFERCYSGKTANVGMYDAMFAAGLRLPLTAFHR